MSCKPTDASNQVVDMVISGGQIGADQAALYAAKRSGIETCGWAPKGYLTMDGPNELLDITFHLKEAKTDSYPKRSMMNVDFSDGTLAFRTHISAGTEKTIGYCITKKWQTVTSVEYFGGTVYKPVMLLNIYDDLEGWPFMIERVRGWIEKHNIRILNVCGHANDTTIPGRCWREDVEEFMMLLLNPPCTVKVYS